MWSMPKLIEKMRKSVKSTKQAVKTTGAKKASNTMKTGKQKQEINRKIKTGK
jgi:hypothetical protein